MNFASIKNKLNLVSAIISILLITQATLLIGKSSALNESSIHNSNIDSIIVEKSYELQIAVIQVQQWLTDISATRGLDGLNNGFKVAEEQANIARQLIDELAELNSNNVPTYDNIRPIFEQYYSSGKTMAKQYIEHGPSAGNKFMTNFDNAAASINESVGKILIQNQISSKAQLDSQIALSTDMNFWTITFTILYFVTLIALMAFLRLAILKPIDRLKCLTGGLAHGDADLSTRLDETSKSELGEISRSVNLFISNLQGMIKSVDSTANNIKDSIVTLSNTASENNNAAQGQLSRTDSMTSSMMALKNNSQQMVEHANDASSSTKSVTEEVTQGDALVNSTMNTITQLASEIGHAEAVIQKLSEDSQNIGSVLGVIQGIAEQTNLLALNAAIEAARAGEQGRGFAVVADEVRTLASRTQESAAEISNMINQLQSRVVEVSSVMGASINQAGESVNEGQKAKQSLDTITVSMSSIDDKASAIAQASMEQSQMADELDDSITEIANVSRNSAQNSSMVVATADEVIQYSEQLHQLMRAFKH